MEKVKIESKEDFLASTQAYIDRSLRKLALIGGLVDAIHEVGNTWCPKSRHKFARGITGRSWGYELEYTMYLGKDDSLASLITFFEALESLLPDIKWVGTRDATSSRTYRCRWKSLDLNFEVRLARSESCKMVPVYATQSVVVGHKAVCR